jgi:hypothetical protein
MTVMAVLSQAGGSAELVSQVAAAVGDLGLPVNHVRRFHRTSLRG